MNAQRERARYDALTCLQDIQFVIVDCVYLTSSIGALIRVFCTFGSRLGYDDGIFLLFWLPSKRLNSQLMRDAVFDNSVDFTSVVIDE